MINDNVQQLLHGITNNTTNIQKQQYNATKHVQVSNFPYTQTQKHNLHLLTHSLFLTPPPPVKADDDMQNNDITVCCCCCWRMQQQQKLHVHSNSGWEKVQNNNMKTPKGLSLSPTHSLAHSRCK